ncbi:MAG: GAP family protein [Solirubrobacteraceae bacterium]|jgi:cytochrome c biogenesis protein CcdA
MLRLIGLVLSIGLADSLNPSTIAPALFLASGERPTRRVSQFTAAVFAVYLAGGLVIAFGPGQLLLSLLPHPRRHVRYGIELAAGVAMLAAAAMLWRHRDRLGQRDLPATNPQGRSSALLGATITAVELPTAFPYFAAIAAIVGADVDGPRAILLLVLFNFCFVAPLLGIVGTLIFGGSHAQRMLATGRSFLERHWPAVLSGLALLAGAFVVTLGATGLASASHNHLGRMLRRFRHLLHP